MAQERSEAQRILAQINLFAPAVDMRGVLFNRQDPFLMHVKAFRYAMRTIDPFLEAHSEPERVPMATEGSCELSWGLRRQLNGAPSITVDQVEYWIHLRQSILPDGNTASFVLEGQTYAPNPVFLGQIGARLVYNWDREVAVRADISQLLRAAHFIQANVRK